MFERSDLQTLQESQELLRETNNVTLTARMKQSNMLGVASQRRLMICNAGMIEHFS